MINSLKENGFKKTGQECEKTVKLKLCVNVKYYIAVENNVNGTSNKSILCLETVLILHRSCSTSKDASGQCKNQDKHYPKPPSCIFLPAWNVNPALSLTSPLIFASLLIEQGL